MKTNQPFVPDRAKPKLTISFLIGILLVFGSVPVNSQVLGNWNFTNTLVGTNGLYNLVNTASFSPFISSTAFNGGTEYYGENNWPAGAINTAAYLQFSLWPTLGYQLNMTAVTLRMRRSNTGSPAGSGPTSWSVRSSLDGFTSDIASGTMDHNYANYTVPLPYTFLSLPLPIVFCVYGYNATVSSGGTSRMVFDNISASGLSAVLPIKVSAFTATSSADNVTLKFTMQQTEPGTKYIIERSTDSRNFLALTTITETGNVPINYSYNDHHISTSSSKFYYRLKLMDIDGATTYSSIILVNLEGTTVTNKFQFSTSGRNLHINGQFKSSYTIELYNTVGVRLYHFTPATTAQNLVLNLSSNLPAGSYVAVVNGERSVAGVVILR